jgi:hypothetical protein
VHLGKRPGHEAFTSVQPDSVTRDVDRPAKGMR